MVALGIRGVRFRYRGARATSGGWVVDVDALDLMPGEQLLLTGGSGRGKSTLLHLIAGLIDPDQGRIYVAGEEVHALHGAKRDLFRGRHIGMIFQTFNLLHGFSAVENVMAPMMFSDLPRREHRRRALELLETLGIDEPERRPDELSVGQQQRVAVARALACGPALVLADEPTASLDPANAAIAMDLIQQACAEREIALLCTSHDPTLAPRFERRMDLEELRGEGDGGDEEDGAVAADASGNAGGRG